MSTSGNIPTQIPLIYTPESLTPTVVCDLGKKKIPIAIPQQHSFIAATRQKWTRDMEINLLFAVFLIPFLITRDKRSHLRNLPRLQDDQEEDADNKVFGTASVPGKPRRMADRAILAQVFHPHPSFTQADKLRVRRF